MSESDPNPNNPKQRVFFAVMNPDEGGVPTILLGVSNAAMKHMKKGRGHDFDLTKAGMPIKFAMFGCRDYQHFRDILNLADTSQMQEKFDIDFSFDTPPEGEA